MEIATLFDVISVMIEVFSDLHMLTLDNAIKAIEALEWASYIMGIEWAWPW